MKPILPLLLLLLANPAAAQSYYPNLAGQRFCELRQLGIDREQARTVAMRENWAPHRQSLMITTPKGTYSLDDLDYARWIVMCDGN